MKHPNPEYNAGAREERAAIRGLIRTKLKHAFPASAAIYEGILDAIKLHVKTAAKRKGGLGGR